MVLTPKKTVTQGKASFIRGPVSNPNAAQEEPELVCREKELDPNIEEEIKEGFFELKQKFKEAGESSIYVSHVVLHAKHPIFSKLDLDTLKQLLTESSVIYLNKD